jgi:hypothetical protein
MGKLWISSEKYELMIPLRLALVADLRDIKKNVKKILAFFWYIGYHYSRVT